MRKVLYMPQTWLSLIMSLPTQNSTARMRVWRSLKSLGCVALRDGVYLIPYGVEIKQILDNHLQDVCDSGGSGYLLAVDATDKQQSETLKRLFDRTADYASAIEAIKQFRSTLKGIEEGAARRGINRLRRELAAITAVDFYPNQARDQAMTALLGAETEVESRFSPGEPRARPEAITRCDKTDYQGRIWATRQRPWIDRLASAWLIKRYIDPKASFCWLAKPKDCPKGAVGFDFDGAEFTHQGNKVTFEVLLASFGLQEQEPLSRLGAAVHYLDVGGVPRPEAAGLELILRGARASADSDDALLKQAIKTFDLIHAAWLQELKADL
ncbi:MAG: chromate resistance protein [Burkholderiales bacterium]|nr:chromate resistance protein [Burkholderiales bacterium]